MNGRDWVSTKSIYAVTASMVMNAERDKDTRKEVILWETRKASQLHVSKV